MEGLIKHRAIYKAAITRIENYVNRNKLDKNVLTSEFSVRQEALIDTFKNYEEIQNQIEETDDSDAQNTDRVNIESKYFTIKAILKDIIADRSVSKTI